MDNAQPVLVIGGGIAGITAAVEAAEAGLSVILVEKSPFLGGRVARFNHYFPKLCPPACGLEINFKRIKNNSRITVLTQAQVEQITGTPGNFEATVRLEPRYVSAVCTACGDCAKVVPHGRREDRRAVAVSGALRHRPRGVQGGLPRLRGRLQVRGGEPGAGGRAAQL